MDHRRICAGALRAFESACLSNFYLHHKVFRSGMMHDDGRRALLRLQQETVVSFTPMFSSGRSSANSFVWSSRFGHAGYPNYSATRDISGERDRECAASPRRAMPSSGECPMRQLSQRLGRFHAQPMQVEVLGVLSAFEKLLRLVRCDAADGHARHTEHVHLPLLAGRKKSEMHSLRPPPAAGRGSAQLRQAWVCPASSLRATRRRSTSLPLPWHGSIRRRPSARTIPAAITSSSSFSGSAGTSSPPAVRNLPARPSSVATGS